MKAGVFAPGISRKAIFGSLLWEQWHRGANVALSGSNVVSWGGMWQSVPLAPQGALNRPPLQTDGAFWYGQKCIRIAFGAGTGLFFNSGVDLLPATTKPTLIFTGRVCGLQNNTRQVFGLATSSALLAGLFAQTITPAGTERVVVGNLDGTFVLPSWATLDTQAHVTTYGLDGATTYAYVDGTAQLPGSATAGNFNAGLRTINVGIIPSGAFSGQNDLAVVELMLLLGRPTVAQLTAYRAIAHAEFNTP